MINEHLLKACNEADTFARSYVNDNIDKDCGGACGFAWVNVYGIRKKADKEALKQAGFSRNEYEKAWQLWVRYYGQSVDAKASFAGAYAKALRELTNLEVYAGSRLD